MPSINPILDAAQSIQDQTSSVSNQLAANTLDIESTYDNDESLQLDIGKQTAVINQAKATAALAAKNDLNKVALGLGGDIGDTTGTMAGLVASFSNAANDQASALQEVNQKKSVSFFDDPIQWLTNQFTINQSIAKYNAATSTKNQAEQHIKDINTLIDSRAQADAKLENSIDQGSIDAQAKITADQAQLAANDAHNKAVIANSTLLEKQTSLGIQALEAQSKAYNAEVSQQQLSIAQQHLALAQQTFAFTEQERQQKIDEQQAIQARVQLGYNLMYGTDSQASKIASSPAVLAMIRGGANAMDPVTLEAFRVGSLNMAAGTGQDSRILATSPSDMLQVLKFNPTMSPAQNGIKDILLQAKTDLEGNAAGAVSQAYQAAVAAKDKNTQDLIFNRYAAGLLNKDSQRVDGPNNPFYLPSFDKIAATTPGLQQTDFYQNVIAPGIKAGVAFSDPTQVLRVGADMPAGMKLNQIAADIATTYFQGARVNSIAKSFAAMGFNPPHTYNYQVPGIGIVNMADPQAVLNALVKMQVQKMNEGVTPQM